MKHAPDCRDRLLKAATELFGRHGYDGTSVRAITRRAHANLGAITYHFGSKETLYHQVIAAQTEPLARRVAGAADGTGAPLDRIERIVRDFLDHVATHPEMPRVLLRELASERPLPPPAQDVMRRNFGAISETIRAGQQDGSIRPGDPALLALSVMAQPFHLVIAGRALFSASGVNPADPQTRARLTDHVSAMVRRMLAASQQAVR